MRNPDLARCDLVPHALFGVFGVRYNLDPNYSLSGCTHLSYKHCLQQAAGGTYRSLCASLGRCSNSYVAMLLLQVCVYSLQFDRLRIIHSPCLEPTLQIATRMGFEGCGNVSATLQVLASEIRTPVHQDAPVEKALHSCMRFDALIAGCRHQAADASSPQISTPRK